MQAHIHCQSGVLAGGAFDVALRATRLTRQPSDLWNATCRETQL